PVANADTPPDIHRGRKRERSLCLDRACLAPRAQLGRALRQRRSVRAHQRGLGSRRLALWTVSARIVTTRANTRPRGRGALDSLGGLAASLRAARSTVRISRRCTATMKVHSILETIGNTPHIRVA